MSIGTTLLRSKYGELLATPATEAQWVENPTPTQCPPPLEPDRYCRNGQHVNPIFQNQINAAANATVLYRSQQVFNYPGFPNDTATSFGAGDRTRWNFSWRSGPYCHALGIVAVLMPPTSGYTNNTKARLDIYSDAALTTLVASTEVSYGAGNSSITASDFNSWITRVAFVDSIAKDTEFYGVWVDVDYGILFSACVFELASMTENTGGYLSTSTTTHTPVLNLHRQLPVDISNALLQKGSGNIFSWTTDGGIGTSPITNSTTTATNIIDLASTAVSSSSGGFDLDEANKDRLASGAVIPCTFKALGKFGAGTGGSVILYNSAGTVIATLNGSWGTTASWKSTTFNLPATVDKYDIMFKSTSGGTTFSLYAASIRPYG